MNNLLVQNTIVEGKVNQAKHRGEAVDDNVLLWLKDFDETRQGVDKLMDEKTVKENMLCFNFSCPDFISRYHLSKQAEKKVVRIKHLAEDGSKIGTVSHPRENPLELVLPSSRDYEDFHSRQKVFKGIVDALKDSNVNMIGVYGAGGVGKTTMVEKVGKLMKEDGTFDEVVMAIVSKDANVINIQGQLANRLNLTLTGETEVGRAKQLWNRLDNGKKNLMILDDIWRGLDLKILGIPIKVGNKRCKVVLTSRNRDVWKNMDVDVDFHVEFLTKEESWTLFKKKVGNHVDSHGEPRRDIAWAICHECQGLPVAINAIGATLKGKDLHAWKDAFHKLKNSMLKDIVGIDQKVYASLKWSYDQLASEDAKSCFLLCCLFAEDAEISIDDLVRYYMAWRTLHRYQMLVTLEQAFDQVCTVVDTLKSCCLLLDGTSKHLVKMHDVVRDIAISIAEDEKSFLVKHGFKDWPKKAAYEHCSVISLRLDDVRKFPDKLVCPKLHTFRLDCSINRSPLEVPDKFFIGMGNLMVLDLTRVIMSRLPTSLANLAKLQMLCLNQCHLGDIYILKDLKDHLEILSLQGSNIKVLPLEVGELTRLRLLDMSDCQELEMIPKGVISKLFRLEELCMPMSFGNWMGTTDERAISNASLDELMSLTRLTTLNIWIPDAALLPKDLSFENLVRFEIIISKRWHFRPRDYTKPRTGILILENFHVANNYLEFLLGKPKWSISRNGLYPSIFINHLIDLSVRDCGMKYLFSPSCARELVGLQRLTIKHCGVMEGVIETEKDKHEDIPIIFSGLKLLNLENLPNLISFYPEKGKTATSSGSSSGHAQTVLFNDKVILPSLEDLRVSALDRIEEIWDKQSPLVNQETVSFGQLKDMMVSSCRKLTNLFPSTILPRLQNLQTLLVAGCPNVEFVVFKNGKGEEEVADDSTLIIPLLRHLHIEKMEKLKSFYSSTTTSNAESLFNHQVTCPRLENLELEECKSLRCIFQPSMASVLVDLQELIINDCSKMEAVFDREEEIEDGQGRNSTDKTLLPHLRKLELRCLPGLRRFCHFRYPVELPLLSRMVILGCPKMNSFSLGQVSTPNLALQGGEIIAPPGLELASIMDWEDFHSRHKVFNGIVEALKDPEVNMIAVYGAGGVGKTTMVDVVGERMERDGIFDEVIKAVVSYDANVRKIQGQLANHLNLMLDAETEVGIAIQLWNRLDNGKKNLIILDDVWQELDLNTIGIPITEQNKRCKVVITSQNRDVWKNMDVHKDFKIEFLSKEEAWTLFKKVGNVDLNDQPLRDIAWAICKDCEGLPLAVKAFAAALRGKDINAWQDALEKLNKSMLRDIEGINRWLYEPLRWSYDRLDYEDAKSCFLLCCLFSEDAEILVDGLVRYCMVWGTLDRKPDTLQRGLYRVRKLVDTLKSQGLLLDGNSEDTVKMHAVMRHVSTSIANNDESFFVDHHVKQWPAKATYEHCSVISLRPDDMRKFPNELVCPKLHTLRLDYTGNKSHAQVPDKFFSGMENLTILDLKRVTPPASLAKLAKLKMLCLEGCNLGDIAILKNLNDHLEILSLRGSNIEVLPSEVGELTRLRLLDMADCKELGMIPKGVISKLFLLEELYMPWNFRQWEGMTDERQINCVSLDELMALTQLTTLHIYIPDTALLLKDFTFENLVRFRISFGGEGFLGNWSLGDGALVLENIHIANALERLLGMQRNGLHPSTSFDHLTSLSFRDCRVKYLFSPSCARGLVQLKYLTVESCTVMEGVIGTEGEKDEDEVIIFKLLKYLRLKGLPNLMSFYHGKEKTATSSESSSAHARMVLFNDKVIFPILEILELEGCKSLRYIFQPSMPRGLVKLQELIINDCSKMEAVFDREEEIEDGQGRKSTDKTLFPHLSKLELRRLPELRWFCQFRYPLEMPLLSQMVIEVCPRLNSFSSGSVNSSSQAQMVLFNVKLAFPRLENLELDGCESLRCIFQLSMARVLVNLQQLIIHDCSKMEAVVDGEEEIEDGQGRKSTDKTLFPHLSKLELRRLPELRWFCHFRYPLELPLLSQMVIEVCPRLNSSSWGSVSSSAHAQMVLFNDQVTFPRLENLELEGCGSLKYIFQPSIARILVSLQELIINNCSKIVAVVGGEEQIEDGQGRESTDKTLFPHLSTLELRRLPELRRFCYFRYPLELPLLSQMVIEVCPRLNSIFFSSGSVSSSAHAQMVLFNDKVTFPRLENLEIEGCESLKYTFQPSMARVLVNLQKLIINDCSKMVAVVGGEEEIEDGQGRESTVKTLFPHLSTLELRHLPELRRFCYFRYPLELPRLSQMVIEVCPRLNAFSSGSVGTPNLFARFVSYDFVRDDTTVTEEEPSNMG